MSWSVSDNRKIIVRHRVQTDPPAGPSFAYATSDLFPGLSTLPPSTRLIAEKGNPLDPQRADLFSDFPGGRTALTTLTTGRDFFRVRPVYRSAEAVHAALRLLGKAAASIPAHLEPLATDAPQARAAKHAEWSRAFTPSTVTRDVLTWWRAHFKGARQWNNETFLFFLIDHHIHNFAAFGLYFFVKEWLQGAKKAYPAATDTDCDKYILSPLLDYCGKTGVAELWKAAITDADSYTPTLPNDCTTAAMMATGLTNNELRACQDHLSHPPYAPSPGSGLYTPLPDLDYCWRSHYATVMLSDGHDHLTYETVSSRLVPLHHARGMGYFDLYTSQSHHPRRFARRLHSYAQDTVTLFSSQDLHYLNRRQNKDLFRHRPIDQQAMADTITAQAVKDQEALIKSLQGA